MIFDWWRICCLFVVVVVVCSMKMEKMPRFVGDMMSICQNDIKIACISRKNKLLKPWHINFKLWIGFFNSLFGFIVVVYIFFFWIQNIENSPPRNEYASFHSIYESIFESPVNMFLNFQFREWAREMCNIRLYANNVAIKLS